MAEEQMTLGPALSDLTRFDPGSDLIIVKAHVWGPRGKMPASLAVDTGSAHTVVAARYSWLQSSAGRGDHDGTHSRNTDQRRTVTGAGSAFDVYSSVSSSTCSSARYSATPGARYVASLIAIW